MMFFKKTVDFNNEPLEKKSLSKRFISFLILLISVIVTLYLLVSLGQFLITNVSSDQLNKINESIESFAWFMLFIRMAIYALLFLYWQSIIRWFGYFNKWDQVVIDRGIASRFSSMAILLTVEFFLISRVHLVIYDFIKTL